MQKQHSLHWSLCFIGECSSASPQKQVHAYLNAEYTEDDEESAADEDDVSDGLEGRQECLDHQL